MLKSLLLHGRSKRPLKIVVAVGHVGSRDDLVSSGVSVAKHQIVKVYKERDAAGNTVHVLHCLCGWKDKDFNSVTLRGTYRHHVVTQHNKGN